MPSKIILTPSHFYRYSTHPLWIWYDLFGDQTKKEAAPDFMLKLMEKGVLYEKSYISNLQVVEVLSLDPDTAFGETLELMKQGVGLIYQGCIKIEDNDVIYRGRPDLLEKRKGDSIFGDWYYAPVDIKYSSKVKSLHKNQLAFYAMVLEKLQGYFPPEAYIIDRLGNRIPVLIDDTELAEIHKTIIALLYIMHGNRPEINIKAESKNSPWFKLMLDEAEETQDIALIYQLDSRALNPLRAVGIKSLHDLLQADLTQLPKIPYAPIATLEKKQLQAKSLIENKVILTNAISLPDTVINIYFDIEGDPFIEHGINYLFGALVVGDLNRLYAKSKNVKFYEADKDKYFVYFVAEAPKDEALVWHEFLEWLNVLPEEYTVYHYANYEKTNLNKLAKMYGSSESLQKFQTRLIDLYAVISASLIFPVYFYSIKDIAKSEFINFQWRDEKANGSKSIDCYEQWLETGNTKILQGIIEYNEDDLRATEQVHLFLKKLYEFRSNV